MAMYVLKGKTELNTDFFYKFSEDEKDCYPIITDNINTAQKYTKEDAIRLSANNLLFIRKCQFYEIGLCLLNTL